MIIRYRTGELELTDRITEADMARKKYHMTKQNNRQVTTDKLHCSGIIKKNNEKLEYSKLIPVINDQKQF